MLASIDSLIDNTGLLIGSLTTRSDDLNQWRSYAENGSGCVLGIDASYLENDGGVAIRSVIYEKDIVNKILHNAIQVVQQQYIDAPHDIEKLFNFSQYASVDLFNIKHPGFADEREVRISRMVVKTSSGSLTDVGGTRANGSSIPPLSVRKRKCAFGDTSYVALPLTRQDGSSAIVNVRLGPTMPNLDRSNYRD